MKRIYPIIHTKFLHFLWEKYNGTIDSEDEDNIPIPLPEDDEDLHIALKLTPACARMVPLKTDLLNERVKAVAFSG